MIFYDGIVTLDIARILELSGVDHNESLNESYGTIYNLSKSFETAIENVIDDLISVIATLGLKFFKQKFDTNNFRVIHKDNHMTTS